VAASAPPDRITPPLAALRKPSSAAASCRSDAPSGFSATAELLIINLNILPYMFVYTYVITDMPSQK
jgi:hypothetical protein